MKLKITIINTEKFTILLSLAWHKDPHEEGGA